MHKSKKKRVTNKTGTQHMQAVMGMLERKRGDKHSTVRLAHVPTTKARDIHAQIRANIERGSNLYTDDLASYRNIKLKMPDAYKHAAVDHAVRYVDGQVHTNGLENFWSLLKRAIKGTYVSVDPFHLFRYLDEQTFRFNTRELTDGQRFRIALKEIIGKRLTYNELISADMIPATT